MLLLLLVSVQLLSRYCYWCRCTGAATAAAACASLLVLLLAPASSSRHICCRQRSPRAQWRTCLIGEAARGAAAYQLQPPAGPHPRRPTHLLPPPRPGDTTTTTCLIDDAGGAQQRQLLQQTFRLRVEAPLIVVVLSAHRDCRCHPAAMLMVAAVAARRYVRQCRQLSQPLPRRRPWQA